MMMTRRRQEEVCASCMWENHRFSTRVFCCWDNRNIGDFRKWEDHDAYEKALEQVLRDLKMAQTGP